VDKEDRMNLDQLFKNAEDVESFKAGETIFSEGAAGDEMYVVLDGEAEIRVAGESVEVVGIGGIIGEMALIDSKERSASAVAKSDCRLAAVNEHRFMFLVQETPFFALHVMRILANRLRHMNLLQRA
jgi:CRP-like cAMP-binding protein